MRNVKIPGAIDNVGLKQGYDGISVLATVEDVLLGGQTKEMDVCKVVYELDDEEKKALVEGGRITLTILGKVVVPHRLNVQPC